MTDFDKWLADAIEATVKGGGLVMKCILIVVLVVPIFPLLLLFYAVGKLAPKCLLEELPDDPW